MQRVLPDGIARSPEGPEKCRQEGISAQYCGPGACPWLCKPRPFLRHPVFPERCSGKWCDLKWGKHPTQAMHITRAPQFMQSREMRFVSAAKWIALQFVATQTGSA